MLYAGRFFQWWARGLSIPNRAEMKIVPSPSAASSQAFSSNAFWWRIWGETLSDYVTRKA